MVHEQASRSPKNSARRARERARRIGWLTEAQAALGWGVILILAALLGAIYLNQASRIAAVGRRVQFLQNDLDNLRRVNASLERQIAEAQSLERLQQEAIRLGFREARAEDIEYIVVPGYPPEAGGEPAALTATPAPVTAPPPETMQEVLWLVLRRSVNDLIQGEAAYEQ